MLSSEKKDDDVVPNEKILAGDESGPKWLAARV
jgi:hypothetical protein